MAKYYKILAKIYHVGIYFSTCVTFSLYMYHNESSWNKVNSCHSSLNGAVFWICNKNSADNKGVCWLFLSRVCTTSKLSLLPTLPPPSKQDGKAQKVGREWLTRADQRNIQCHTMCSVI